VLKRPWSNNQLKRVTAAIREGRDGDVEPSFSEIAAWYDSLLSELQSDLLAYLEGHWIGPEILFSARVKTIDTLRDKLRRYPNQRLNTVRDIIGLRVEADVHLRHQDALVDLVKACFEGKAEEIRTIDYRQADQFGYRAVHLELIFGEPIHARAEVQIRTALQGVWANIYERMAEIFGREIRYNEAGEIVEKWSIIRKIRKYSTEAIARIESDWTGADEWDVRLRTDPAFTEIKRKSPELEATIKSQLAHMNDARQSILEDWAKVESDLLESLQQAEQRNSQENRGG
jgi:ppGpp synthetase/RelA/SpoT-type nucleotidyltranferase